VAWLGVGGSVAWRCYAWTAWRRSDTSPPPCAASPATWAALERCHRHRSAADLHGRGLRRGLGTAVGGNDDEMREVRGRGVAATCSSTLSPSR
jgi:hypothetical protein